MAGLDMGLIGTWETKKTAVPGSTNSMISTMILNSDDTGKSMTKINDVEVWTDTIKILKSDSMNKTLSFKFDTSGQEATCSYVFDSLSKTLVVKDINVGGTYNIDLVYYKK